jgi:hypothetical protein
MASQRRLWTPMVGMAAVGAGAAFYGIAGALFAAGIVSVSLVTRRAARWFAPDIDPDHHRAINNNSST